MSQKEKKKDNSKGKGGLDGQSQTKIYQAIVIASSQEDDFVSHDSGSPVCLQEVAGAPILDYVLKGLNSPKIKEIIVVSGNYKLQLEQYLSQYTLDKFPKRVEFMYAEGANSIGDYLREVESHQKVQEFFVLVHGGLMTNAKIDDILEEFERNMEIDNNMVMLKVFSKGSTLSEQRSGQDCEFVMLDEENRIMKLDNTSDKRVCLQENFRLEFSDISKYRIRFDLYDTGLSVCKTNVLKNFRENFDYKNEREYLDELLASEVLAETIFLHELPSNRYALDVKNPQLLLRANLDSLRGYVDNLMNFDLNSVGRFRERFLLANEPNSFYCSSVYMDYDCHLGVNSLIMEKCNLGSRCRFSGSVLGPGCIVGPDSQVTLSLLSRDVQVGPKCIIKNSYIGRGVKIGPGSKIINCLLEENTTVEDGSKLEGLQLKNSRELLPFTGTANFRKGLLEDDDELNFGDSEEESSEEIEDPAAKLARFVEEVKKYIFDAEEDGEKPSKVASEISYLKLDTNMEFSGWVHATTRGVYELIKHLSSKVAQNRAEVFDRTMTNWKPIFEPFKTEASQLEILKSISAVWCEEKVFTVLNGVQLAYKHEIVSKDAIIEWHDSLLEASLKPKFSEFHKYLLSLDDSDDSDSSAESSESSSKSSS